MIDKMEKDLMALEEELRAFAPSPLSAEALSRMVSAMERWETQPSEAAAEDTVDGKIVPFPAGESRRKRSWQPMWGAAAAVAILGALGALILPVNKEDRVVAMENLGPVPLLRQASFIPVNSQRKVDSMVTGVTTNSEGDPYQVIGIIRQNEASFEADDNVGLKISRPQVDYYFVPISY